MPYATFAMLADAPGARELAEVATPEHMPVCDADKLDHLLRGGTWDTADVTQARAWHRAEAAQQVIASAIVAADALIDGYLAKKGYRLPLEPCPSLVSQWARSITRYLLHKDRRTLDDRDPICRNYRDALRLLQQTADGHFSLGVGDWVQIHKTDAQLGSTAAVQMTCGRPDPYRIFGRAQMRWFR